MCIRDSDYIALGCNLSTPALQDINVRQAMSYAMDRDATLNVVFGGKAVPCSMVPPGLGHWCLDVSDMELYQTNVEKAKELMEAAGYNDEMCIRDRSQPAGRALRTVYAAPFLVFILNRLRDRNPGVPGVWPIFKRAPDP